MLPINDLLIFEEIEDVGNEDDNEIEREGKEFGGNKKSKKVKKNKKRTNKKRTNKNYY
jgi:hypothetical protein